MDLQQLLDLQHTLDVEVGKVASKRIYPIDLILPMYEEVSEIAREIGFKWWRPKKELDRERTLEEMCDLLHFWLAMALRLNFTADDIERKYKEKRLMNLDRLKDV